MSVKVRKCIIVNGSKSPPLPLHESPVSNTVRKLCDALSSASLQEKYVLLRKAIHLGPTATSFLVHFSEKDPSLVPFTLSVLRHTGKDDFCVDFALSNLQSFPKLAVETLFFMPNLKARRILGDLVLSGRLKGEAKTKAIELFIIHDDVTSEHYVSALISKGDKTAKLLLANRLGCL